MKLIQIRLAGAGGQGIQTAGKVLAHAAILQKKFAAATQTVGPEAREGVSISDVILSDRPIDFPCVTEIDILIPFTQPQYEAQHDGKLAPSAVIFADPDLVSPRKKSPHRHFWVPALSRVNKELGEPQAAAVCMVAVLARAAKIVSMDALTKAIKGHFQGTESLPQNLKAFEIGVALGKKIRYAP